MIAALERARAALGHTGAGRRNSAYDEAMLPRVVLLVVTAVLVLFGLLMIYSASSIMGLTSADYNHNPAYFLLRQLAFVAVGVAFAAGISLFDYHRYQDGFLRAIWVVTVMLLVVVRLVGQETYGAARWIPVGPFTLQPSEFAKITVILVGARLCETFFVEGGMDPRDFAKHVAIGLGIPLALIFIEPDKGTTGVLVAVFLIMCVLSGVSVRSIAVVAGIVFAGIFAYCCFEPYALARITAFMNPFADEWNTGYQLVQSLYAFGSGGLKGVGIGLSRQKYNYLPMAHNDFILAVVGEELGFVGIVLVLLLFATLVWAGLKIAETAPDLTGKLIATGCTSLLIIQFLLNITGVLGMFPLSGKPVPFISYGGSSVMSCLMLVGLVNSVSRQTSQEALAHEIRREQLRIATEEAEQESLVGVPTRRSMRLAMGSGRVVPSPTPYARSEWRVMEGGAARTRSSQQSRLPQSRPEGRIIVDSNGRRRLDLGPSAADRLRGSRRGRE